MSGPGTFRAAAADLARRRTSSQSKCRADEERAQMRSEKMEGWDREVEICKGEVAALRHEAASMHSAYREELLRNEALEVLQKCTEDELYVARQRSAAAEQYYLAKIEGLETLLRESLLEAKSHIARRDAAMHETHPHMEGQGETGRHSARQRAFEARLDVAGEGALGDNESALTSSGLEEHAAEPIRLLERQVQNLEETISFLWRGRQIGWGNPREALLEGEEVAGVFNVVEGRVTEIERHLQSILSGLNDYSPLNAEQHALRISTLQLALHDREEVASRVCHFHLFFCFCAPFSCRDVRRVGRDLCVG
jgi:hypothetical protein